MKTLTFDKETVYYKNNSFSVFIQKSFQSFDKSFSKAS